MAIALRAWPRIKWPIYPGWDRDFHLVYVDLIRRHNFRMPRSDPRFLRPGRADYPAGYHYVLARLGPAVTRWMDRFGAILFDVLGGIAIVSCLVRAGTDWAAAPLLVALYVLFPPLTAVAVGPRAYTLTTRNLAQFLFTLIFAAAIVLYPDPDRRWLLMALTIPIVATVILSSKFGLQFALFAAPVVAVIAGSILPLLALVAGFFLAAVVARDFLFVQLKSHLLQFRVWRRLGTHHTTHGRNWRVILAALRAGQYRLAFRQSYFRNPIIGGLVRSALLFVTVAAYGTLEAPTAQQDIAALIGLVAIPPWLITSFGPARILGHGDRYLEYTTPVQWYLVGSLLSPSALVPVGLIAFAAFVVFLRYNLRIFDRQGRARDLPGRFAAAKLIDTEPGAVLLCLRSQDTHFYYLHSRAVLCNAIHPICPLDQSLEEIRYFWDPFPLLNRLHLRAIARDYGVRFVLARKQDLRPSRNGDPEYDLSGFDRLYESDVYLLFRVPAETAKRSGDR